MPENQLHAGPVRALPAQRQRSHSAHVQGTLIPHSRSYVFPRSSRVLYTTAAPVPLATPPSGRASIATRALLAHSHSRDPDDLASGLVLPLTATAQSALPRRDSIRHGPPVPALVLLPRQDALSQTHATSATIQSAPHRS